MSIQPAVLPARAREPRSRRSHRQPPRCQVRGCRGRACDTVDIELPGSWDATVTYGVVVVVACACREHARELRRRAAAVLAIRADMRGLLAIAESASTGKDPR